MLNRLFLLTIIVGNLQAVHPQISINYNNGIEAYKNGNYQLAVQEFEDILNQGWEAPEIYYNLGNAFFRSDEIGEAVWAYEKCLAIKPSHEDAVFNLSLVNLNVIDRIDLPPPPAYLKIYNSIRNTLMLQEWVFALALVFMLFLFFRCLRILFRLKTIRPLENLFIFFFILLLLISSHNYYDTQTTNDAIIFAPVVVAYSEPNEYSTRVMEIHEGLKVMAIDEADDWIEIELLDGKKGWIKSFQLKKLSELKSS